MRLIDADALREELLECAAEGQLTEREARAILDAASTVSCEECRWSPPPDPGSGGARRYCDDCFGSSHFERRQS